MFKHFNLASRDLEEIKISSSKISKRTTKFEQIEFDEIKTYIDKAREMYSKSGTVPAVRIFAKEFGMDRKASKLYEVFESGPMKKIAKYGGLPKPTGCV